MSNTVKSVKIRGIYSTAITNYLLKNNFEISCMSEEQLKRFNKKKSREQADNLIYDKEDLNGITIHGENADEIISLFKKEFNDSLFKKIETGSIFTGLIKKVDQQNKEIYVDIGKDKLGVLSLKNYWGYLRENEKVLVQLKGETKENYILSNNIRLFGKNLILIKDGFTKVSKHFRKKEEIETLNNISEKAREKGWGVLWKSLAENKSEKELEEEINNLLKLEEKIIKKHEKNKTPMELNKGLTTWFVEFGKESKEKLDKLRKEIVPTIKKHHTYKTAGYQNLVDFCEELMKEKVKEETIIKTLENTIFKRNPKIGNYYKIIQKKSNNRDIIISGKIEEFDIKNKKIVIKRIVKFEGTYDGLNIKKEPEDYIITTIEEDKEYIEHSYFDSRGNLKGKYFSITSKMEVFPFFARCNDLEIDVIEKEGNRKKIDEEELKEAVEMGIITKKCEERAKKIANKLEAK